MKSRVRGGREEVAEERRQRGKRKRRHLSLIYRSFSPGTVLCICISPEVDHLCAPRGESLFLHFIM